MSATSPPIDVDLWVWSLEVDDGGRLSAFLSEDEAARAARFVFERDRHRFIVGRGRLREILARELGSTPAALRFAYAAHGKPSLASRPDFHFNLSHSDGLAALAVSREFPLGVDIELVRPLKENVAERFFSPREVEALGALPPEDQLTGFYRCWTRKEAIVKAIGHGLSHPLASFDVSVRADEPAIVERFGGEADASSVWRLMNFEPSIDYAGAVACRTGGRALEIVRREP